MTTTRRGSPCAQFSVRHKLCPMNTPNLVPLKPFDAFKPGSFVANDGRKLTFQPSVIDELAESYDPAVFAAPIVVGHPKTDSPAYGHVGALGKSGETLQVMKSEVTPEFAAAAIGEKRYNKISIKMFLPDSPANPKPGKHYLQHVGFLGGVPPAVPGMAPVALAASDDGSVEFSVAFDYEDRVVARLFRSLRDWMIGEKGVETADRVLPDWDVNTLAEAAVQEEEGDQPQAAFSQQVAPLPSPPAPLPLAGVGSTSTKGVEMSGQAAADDAALKLREQELAAREAALAEKEKAAQGAEFAAYADKLVSEGRLLPVQKLAVTEILTALAERKEPSAAFAAGDENHGKTPLELAQGLLAALPVQVSLGELRKPKEGAAAQAASFSTPAGYSMSPEDAELYQAAVEYQASHPGVDLITAALAVKPK